MHRAKLITIVKLDHKVVKGRSVPYFQVLKSDLKINMRYLDFELGGGFLANFIDIFLPLFEGLIKGNIEDNVEG